MKRFDQTQLTGMLVRAILGCLLVLLWWPATAQAAFGEQRCDDFSVADMAEEGVATVIFATEHSQTPATPETTIGDSRVAEQPEPVYDETPCSGNEVDADPSSKFCFEDAEGQISTLPSLLARWRGERAADTVLDAMQSAMKPAEVSPPVQLAAASIDVEPVEPDEDVCGNEPDECRSLPPLPPTLTVDGSAPGFRQLLYQVDIPSRRSDDTARAWADLRVGPRAGYRDPPDHPPRG